MILFDADNGSVGLGWGMRLCISNRLPGDVTAGPQSTLQSEVLELSSASLSALLPSRVPPTPGFK